MGNKYLSKSCMIAHLKIAVNIPKVVTFLTAPEIEWNIASSKATDPSHDDVRVNVPENPSDADLSHLWRQNHAVAVTIWTSSCVPVANSFSSHIPKLTVQRYL